MSGQGVTVNLSESEWIQVFIEEFWMKLDRIFWSTVCATPSWFLWWWPPCPPVEASPIAWILLGSACTWNKSNAPSYSPNLRGDSDVAVSLLRFGSQLVARRKQSQYTEPYPGNTKNYVLQSGYKSPNTTYVLRLFAILMLKALSLNSFLHTRVTFQL